MTNTPLIAVTLGDPCGIGPEVVAAALATPDVRAVCRPVVVGSAAVLSDAVALVGASLEVVPVDAPDDAPQDPGVVPVLDAGDLDLAAVRPGRLSAEAGRVAVEWALRAGALCLSGDAGAMATAPINKEAARLAGYEEVGHMELLQRLSGADKVATMLISGGLRVVHLTTHRSLRRACDAVTTESVLSMVALTDESFRAWGFARPRIGVAALNPHASDGGLIGDEEELQIAPAVAAARERGINATGPVPADIVFHQAIQGRYDAVLAMYHDQGHIPVKVHGFEQSVSVNLGLPFVRTSVDHGTAFDIAGKGAASAVSMAEAIMLAAALASGRGLPRGEARDGHAAGSEAR